MVRAYLNSIGTAVPDNDVHARYRAFASEALGETPARRSFERLMSRAQIDHRYAVLPFDAAPGEGEDLRTLYFEGAMPDTASRMRLYERRALALAERAIEALGIARMCEVTHLLVTSCTGFYAPGIDLQIVERFGLRADVERTIVGFMGCYAAINAFKLARHIVRSEARSVVLIVNLEVCSLHLQRPANVEEALGFAIFADGCAASLVSAQPSGLELESFASTLIPASAGEITWRIGALGFDMRLSLDVPQKIAAALGSDPRTVLAGLLPSEIVNWAVHPGGRAVLDAVERAFALGANALAASRAVLREYGNMSSASIVFVLARLLGESRDGPGCALAFGPGMVCETMRFSPAPP